jgi:transmembrane sensor
MISSLIEEALEGYFQGKLDYNERLELLRQIEEDESLRDQFLKLQTVNAIVSLTKQHGDQEEGRLSFSDFMKKRRLVKTQRFLISFLKYAAAIAILVVITVLTTLNLSKKPAPVIAENTVIVPAGQRAMIKLQDGTEVWLNARSTIVYPSQFIGSQRHVTISGEAYFKVAKNENMPFIVNTDHAEIKVLGTTFNINNYPNEGFSQISLIEGALEVTNKGEKVSSVTLKPNQQVTLRNNEFTLDQIRFHNYFLWTEGLYCFNNEPMSDILKRLAVYFNVEIIIENTSISKIRYTGKFRQTEGIDEILRILRKIQPFTVEKTLDGNIIKIK